MVLLPTEPTNDTYCATTRDRSVVSQDHDDDSLCSYGHSKSFKYIAAKPDECDERIVTRQARMGKLTRRMYFFLINSSRHGTNESKTCEYIDIINHLN